MIVKKLFTKGLLLSSLAVFSISVFAANVTVSEQVARAVPAVQTNSAAFLTVKNNDNKEVTLVSADSDIAARVELHGHEMKGDMMRMFKLEHGIKIPAGAEAKLQSGGNHVMLMGLKKPLKEGEKVNITLHFSDGDAIDVKVPVKDLRHQKKDMAHENMKH